MAKWLEPVWQLKLFFSVLFVWAVFSGILICLQHVDQQVAIGIVSLIGDTICYSTAAWLGYAKWRETKNSISTFFLLVFILFIAAAINAVAYQFVVIIKQLELTTIPYLSFGLPFTIFLLLQLFAWLVLFKNGGCSKGAKHIQVVPYFIAAIIIFIAFVFGADWKISYSSVIGIFQIIDTLLELLGFVIALFCLVRANTIWVKYYAIGYLMLVSLDFIVRYGIIQRSLRIYGVLETVFWVLAVLLMLCGLTIAKYGRNQDKSVLMAVNSKAAKTGMWIFEMGLIIAFLFLVIASGISIAGNKLSYFNLGLLPPTIIIFSIILGLISNQLALRIDYTYGK